MKSTSDATYYVTTALALDYPAHVCGAASRDTTYLTLDERHALVNAINKGTKKIPVSGRRKGYVTHAVLHSRTGEVYFTAHLDAPMLAKHEFTARTHMRMTSMGVLDKEVTEVEYLPVTEIERY